MRWRYDVYDAYLRNCQVSNLLQARVQKIKLLKIQNQKYLKLKVSRIILTAYCLFVDTWNNTIENWKPKLNIREVFLQECFVDDIKEKAYSNDRYTYIYGLRSVYISDISFCLCYLVSGGVLSHGDGNHTTSSSINNYIQNIVNTLIWYPVYNMIVITGSKLNVHEQN